jgi:deoxyadenosine/deoxycytidine kinase
MKRYRIESYLSKLEEEYGNFMNAHHRMMSYMVKIEGVNNELTVEDKEKVNHIISKMTKASERIHRRFHENK